MRLKSVWISEYKNLHDFTLTFDGESFLDIFVGKNGSGKSNFLEAVLEIFNHLYDFDSGDTGPGFDYAITFEKRESTNTYKWANGSLINENDKAVTPRESGLPDHLIVYYSGQNTTVELLAQKYRKNFQNKIKGASLSDRRRVIKIGNEYKAVLLAVMLTLDDDCKSRAFLLEKLRIEKVQPDIRITLKRPNYAKGRSTTKYDFDVDATGSDRFWKCEGPTNQFLERLLVCESEPAKEGPIRAEGYLSRGDEYVLYLSIEKFRTEFVADNAEARFHMFDNLVLIDMLKDISIGLEMTGGAEGSISHFSDGQFQSIYIFAVTEMFKDVDCLTLLDEPDAFLHPEWQFQFLQQVVAVSEEAASSNHVLMSSHSASTIASRVQSRIRLFDLDGDRVAPKEPAKAAAIDSLSAGLITFSETDAKISILHSLKDYDGPVLFTEGLTDQMILEVAWRKLNPGITQPFAIQSTFGCDFLRQLLLDKKFCDANKERKLFGLFDFDDAYRHWNIKPSYSKLIQEDVSKGLVRQKLDDKANPLDVFFLLLPIPDGHPLSDQAVNPDTGHHYKAESRFNIELIFYGAASLEEYFVPDSKRPRSGCIKFSEKKKDKFARAVVPELGAEHFEYFRPIFDFITSKT